MLIASEIINKQDILALFQKDLLELGVLATETRNRIHGKNPVITFVIDRNINYTNICNVYCKFCAFYEEVGSTNGYILTYEEIKKKTEELTAIGGTTVLLQGGVNPDIPLSYYTEMIRRLRKDFPSLTIHAFSPIEITFIAKKNKLSVKNTLVLFKDLGLSSIPGGGAEVLTTRVKKEISPLKISPEQWLYVMEEAHQLGIETTATMMFGSADTEEDIAEHLLKIRDLQNRTNGFNAFIPWTFQEIHTELAGKYQLATGVEYLKVLAISRIVLDNIKNIQASWVTQGLKLCQMGLSFGANDVGGIMMEENVVSAAGASYRTSQDEIVNAVHQAGYTLAQRNTDYSIIRHF